MKKTIKIGNSQAFWGDSPAASAALARQQQDLDFLTLDYLAEVSLSIMAIQMEKNPAAGFAKDFLQVIKSLVPIWAEGSKLKIITNAGGLNPQACARGVLQILAEGGCGHLKVAVVTGDNVLGLLRQYPDDKDFTNLDTGKPLTNVLDSLVSANAYLGASTLAQALNAGADIVITGRVADPSLTVAPCLASFGWNENDFDLIAGATVAGHLLECGTQATGGIWTNWLEIEDPYKIGFPIAEVNEDSSFIITKPQGTAGCVNRQTIKEQLLYEIGDPSSYLSPDATVSFLELRLEDLENDRVAVKGARGKPPPEKFKVSATYRDGFKVEGMLAIFGQNAPLKAKKCGQAILNKVASQGYHLDRTNIECLGAGDIIPGVFAPPSDLLECVLRISAADKCPEALEAVAKEIAPMVTSGPQGVTGYTSGRPSVRPVFGYWPCLIAKHKLKPAWEFAHA